MKAKDFLKLVWPDQGHYCIAVPSINQQGKRTYRHSIWDTIDDAYLDGRVRCKSMDVYFGIFTHLADRVLSVKYNKLLPSRKRENMAQAKCLFLDLDVGKGQGKYATQADALAALARFIFRTGFPQPIVVSSGNGLHVYWPLTDPVDADDWKPHAANLRTILDANHVQYDPSRTTDTTSVLRMPSTFNYKDPNDLKKVEVLFEGEGEIENAPFFALLTLLGGAMTPLKVRQSNPMGPGAIVPGTNFPPTDADEVADECEQIRIFRDQKGNIPEHHWYPALGVVGFCTNGRQVAHQWSSGYPGYTHTETEDKLDQWQANGSVASCFKLNSDGAQGVCQKCKHWGGQFKNPIVIVNKKPALAAFVAPATITPPNTCPPPVCDPPKPYARTQGLSVTRWDDVKSLSLNVLFETDLYPISVSTGVVAGHKVNNGVSTWVFREWSSLASVKALTWHQFEVTNDLLSDTRELSKHLRGHGFFNDVTTEVAKYMSAYLRELKAHVGTREQRTHLGWPGLDDISEFALNGKLVTAQGVKPCIMAKTTEIATDGMTTSGSLINQIMSLEFYNHPGYEPQQFAILVALSAPLFMATGQHGVVVNLSGESGASKTTALKAAAGLWGNPAKFIVNGTANGITANAREARMAALLNLPSIVDEITHMEPEAARAMVMSATQARLRDTLKSDRTPREPKLPGHRATGMLTSANSSLHQLVNSGNNQAGTANSARVLEVPCERPTIHTKTQADVAAHEFDANYGWLGEQFLVQAMPTMGLLFDSVRKMSKRIDGDVAVRPIERFIVAAGAPAFVAGAFAAYCGLLNWDMPALYDWYVHTLFPHARRHLTEQGDTVASDNVLREFIAGSITDTVFVSAGSTAPFNLRHQVAINHRGSEMWISKQVFADWCRRHGSNIATVLNDLTGLNVITTLDARKNLNEGTPYAPSLNRCFVVDAAHPLVK